MLHSLARYYKHLDNAFGLIKNTFINYSLLIKISHIASYTININLYKLILSSYVTISTTISVAKRTHPRTFVHICTHTCIDVNKPCAISDWFLCTRSCWSVDDGPSTCFSSTPLALIDARCSFTRCLIDNQAAEAAEQIVSIDCRFRRRSRSRMITSFTSLWSLDYFSSVLKMSWPSTRRIRRRSMTNRRRDPVEGRERTARKREQLNRKLLLWDRTVRSTAFDYSRNIALVTAKPRCRAAWSWHLLTLILRSPSRNSLQILRDVTYPFPVTFSRLPPLERQI